MNRRTTVIMGITLLAFCSMTFGLAAGDKVLGGPWHLSKNAKFEAHQIDGIVVVLAYGQHKSTGYKVALRQRPEEIYPPMFELVHTEPGGINAQVLTPYATIGHFKVGAPVKSIRVFDADGQHDVPVKQAATKKKK